MLWGALFLVPPLFALGWFLRERRLRATHAVGDGFQEEIELPYSAEFELYHNALSLCSKKARFCLDELGIDYRGHHIDLIETGRYENIGRDFLRVNPAGTVPVLVHRGHPIYESHEQIRYAAEHAPPGSPSLVPADAQARSEMDRWIDRSSLIGDDPIEDVDSSAGNAVPGLTVPLFAAMIESIPVSRILEGLLFHRLKMRPLLFLAMKLGGLSRLSSGPAAEVVRRSGAAMGRHLDDLEAQLLTSGGPWILGSEFTLADVSWAVVVERLREADSIDVFLGAGRRPATTAWWGRIGERPAYRTAILESGSATIEAGMARLREAKAASPKLRTAIESF